ncbi:prophage tail gpP-like protein [Thalassospira sp. 11-3]|nr:prophage tail gpP-like protein [Thalassospira sp. 11-3]
MKIKINGSYLYHFSDVVVSLALDQVASTFSFFARFNPDNEQHKEIFKPLSFPKVEIYDDNNTLMLTGVIAVHAFKSQAEPSLVQLSGYSLPGVLEDCTIPVSAYPLESINRSLKDIAEKLTKIFNVSLFIDPGVQREAAAIYAKTVAEPTDTIKTYLAKLAAQRNIVLSHNPKGQLVLFRPDVSAQPVYFFNKDNTLNMGFSVNGQGLHNEVSIIRQPSEKSGNASLVDTAKNLLVGAFRPTVGVLSSGITADTKKAADNKMAAELKNISLSVVREGYLAIVPGQTVEAQNKEIYLYQRTRFVADNVTITKKETGYTTEINLVLPETFTGATPKNIFA